MRHKGIIFAAVLVLIAAIAAGYLYEEAPPANTDTPVETPDIDTGNLTIAPFRFYVERELFIDV